PLSSLTVHSRSVRVWLVPPILYSPDQRSTGQRAKKVSVGESGFQTAASDLGMFASDAFSPGALTFGDGLDDSMVMLFANDKQARSLRQLRVNRHECPRR